MLNHDRPVTQMLLGDLLSVMTLPSLLLSVMIQSLPEAIGMMSDGMTARHLSVQSRVTEKDHSGQNPGQR